MRKMTGLCGYYGNDGRYSLCLGGTVPAKDCRYSVAAQLSSMLDRIASPYYGGGMVRVYDNSTKPVAEFWV